MARTEDVEFAGATGARLRGVLHRPEGDARGSVLLAHCFTCGKDLHTMTRLATGLAGAGYAVLRFDFTGLGESGGDFEDTTFTTTVRDLVRAATTLIERGYGPCGMVGHSLGGTATLLAAPKVRTVRSVAVLGAPSDAGHVERLFADEADAIRADGCRYVDIGGRPFPVSAGFLDDLAATDRPGVGDLGRPLLVIHAVGDEIVEVTEGEAIFAAARQPKAFLPLLAADHLVTDRGEAERVVEALVDWFGATL